MAVNKDQILFYLQRHVRQVEEKRLPLNHEIMAAPLSYTERLRAVKENEREDEQVKTELEALREALSFIDAHYK